MEEIKTKSRRSFEELIEHVNKIGKKNLLNEGFGNIPMDAEGNIIVDSVEEFKRYFPYEITEAYKMIGI